MLARLQGPLRPAGHARRGGETAHQPRLSGPKTPAVHVPPSASRPRPRPQACAQTLRAQIRAHTTCPGNGRRGHSGSPPAGRAGGVCHPAQKWVSRHLLGGRGGRSLGALWPPQPQRHSCCCRSSSQPPAASPEKASCARGAGPQSCPLAVGPSLRPVAWQPPGATRATAILISPKPPCFHCVSATWPREPGGTGPGQCQPPVLSPRSRRGPWCLPDSQVKCHTGVQRRPKGGHLAPATGHGDSVVPWRPDAPGSRGQADYCAALAHPLVRQSEGPIITGLARGDVQTVKCSCVLSCPIWWPRSQPLRSLHSNSQSTKLNQQPQLHLHQNWLQRAISTSLIINEVPIYTSPKNKLQIYSGL